MPTLLHQSSVSLIRMPAMVTRLNRLAERESPRESRDDPHTPPAVAIDASLSRQENRKIP
jgi:hypothetical protein